MDNDLRGSKFAVIIHGDGARASIVDGWDAMLDHVRSCLWDGPDGPPEWGEIMADMNDPASWKHNDFGRWHYRMGFEDGSLSVYRID